MNETASRRERSSGARSLDDFAKAFFGMNDGDFGELTYRFEDVVAGLNKVEPYDWTTFLRQRLDAVGGKAPFDGVSRGGYSDYIRPLEADATGIIVPHGDAASLASAIRTVLCDPVEMPLTDSLAIWDRSIESARWGTHKAASRFRYKLQDDALSRAWFVGDRAALY